MVSRGDVLKESTSRKEKSDVIIINMSILRLSGDTTTGFDCFSRSQSSGSLGLTSIPTKRTMYQTEGEGELDIIFVERRTTGFNFTCPCYNPPWIGRPRLFYNGSSQFSKFSLFLLGKSQKCYGAAPRGGILIRLSSNPEGLGSEFLGIPSEMG